MDEPIKDDVPQDNPARWVIELEAASKEEKNWRKESSLIVKRYRGDDCRASDFDGYGDMYNKNSFNILWSNTELLKPAVFTRTPKPLCKPRFYSRKLNDNSVSSAAAQVMERALDQSLNTYDFTEPMGQMVQDALLPGRGVLRIRYNPTFEQVENEVATGEVDEYGESIYDKQLEDKLKYEEVNCEYVNWDDFRRSSGRTWAEVTWVAFRHKMTREDLIESFGEELGKACPLNMKADTEGRKDGEEHVLDCAEVWEIWTKEERKVHFMSMGMKDKFLKTSDDPMNLTEFFPIPRPVQFIKTNSSLIPIPEYSQYATMARELDKVTSRIINLVDAIRARGAYDSTLSEIPKLFEQGDNRMVAVENAARFIESGGFDAAIWMMPIEKYAGVLVQLYQYRTSLVQAIYEITGISDIMRGASSDIETARAQEIKSAFGTLRLQDRQKEVQRFARDLIRIKAEIIGEQFSIDSLKAMTGLEYPTQEEKMQAQQFMMSAQQSMQMGAQGMEAQMKQAQDILDKPSWEEIKETLSSDLLRSFSIDIETDSTLHAEMVEDKGDIIELLKGIVDFMNGISPLVQSGAIPLDAAKALLMAAVRRFKLGTEVEDALEMIGDGKDEQQAPQPDPELIKAQMDMKLEQQKHEMEMQKMQMQAQIDKMSHEAELQSIQARMQAQVAQQQAQMQDKLITGSN